LRRCVRSRLTGGTLGATASLAGLTPLSAGWVAPERSIHYDPEGIAFDDLDQRLELIQ
jgi:hypothetical protein